MTAHVPGVRCKQEMICLLSAPNGLLPHMRKRRTAGRAQGETALFLRRCCCGTKKKNCSQLSDTSCGGFFFLFCFGFFCFSPCWTQLGSSGETGGRFANCSLSGSLQPSPPPDKSLHVHHWDRESQQTQLILGRVFLSSTTHVSKLCAIFTRTTMWVKQHSMFHCSSEHYPPPPTPSSCLSPPSSAFSNTQTPARTRAQ